MRILHVVDSLGTKAAGVATAVEEIIQNQRSLGLDARFVTGDGLPSPTLGSSEGGPGALPARIVRAMGAADLVHIHALWLWATTLAGYGALVRRKPYVVSPHGMLDPWALSQSRLKKAVALRLSELPILNGAACVHALCASEADATRSAGVHADVRVIPPGLSESFVGAAPREREGRTVLFLGRLHPKKGIDRLLRAFARQGRSEPPWRLRVVGPDQAGTLGQLRALAAELRLGDEVEFRGPAYGDEKLRLLDDATLFVLPSHSEGVPTAALEAMARGVPVIVSPACNLPEVQEEGAGFVAPPDVAALGDALQQAMAASPKARQEMGERGQKLVRERYAAARTAEALADLYTEIIQRRRVE